MEAVAITTELDIAVVVVTTTEAVVAAMEVGTVVVATTTEVEVATGTKPRDSHTLQSSTEREATGEWWRCIACSGRSVLCELNSLRRSRWSKTQLFVLRGLMHCPLALIC